LAYGVISAATTATFIASNLFGETSAGVGRIRAPQGIDRPHFGVPGAWVKFDLGRLRSLKFTHRPVMGFLLE
jgi:hypothetical protein